MRFNYWKKTDIHENEINIMYLIYIYEEKIKIKLKKGVSTLQSIPALQREAMSFSYMASSHSNGLLIFQQIAERL